MLMSPLKAFTGQYACGSANKTVGMGKVRSTVKRHEVWFKLAYFAQCIRFAIILPNFQQVNMDFKYFDEKQH